MDGILAVHRSGHNQGHAVLRVAGTQRDAKWRPLCRKSRADGPNRLKYAPFQ